VKPIEISPAGVRWIAVATGAAALGGQVGWSRLAGAAVGTTFAATCLTLAGAMSGLALGAALSPAVAVRRGPRAALGGFLAACAAASALVPFLLLLAGRLHGHPACRFVLVAGLLSLAHVPFGAVLPALAAWRGPSTGRASDGALCAWSAAGAVAGAIGVGGFLAAHLPADLIGGLLAGLVLLSAAPLRARGAASAGASEAAASAVPRPLVAAAFALGFLGLAVEFAWARLLAFAWEASPDCFAWVAATTVAGLAAGSWLASRLPPGRGSFGSALGLASFLLAASAVTAPWAVQARTPEERLAAAAVLLGLPAAAFGASFVLLLRKAAGRGSPGRSLGVLSAANAAGSAAGPLALWAASAALPWPPRILVLAACGYGALAVASAGLRSRRLGIKLSLALPLAFGAWTLAPAGPAAADYAPRPGAAGDFEATVLPWIRGGLEGTVAVTRETDVGLDLLWIDRGLQGDGSALGRRIPERLGRLPAAMLRRPPRRALAIGLGTGLTLRGLLEGGARDVEVAELLADVIEANRTVLADLNGDVLNRPEVRVRCADGRTALADAREPYDLIVADMVFPSVSGAGLLFSREFYATARARLAHDGLFVHWIPALQLPPRDLSSVVAAFLESFPEGTAWIGSLTPRRVVLGLAGGALPAPLADSTSAWMALGPEDLRRLADGARPHRDADAGMEYRSSRPSAGRPFGEENFRSIVDLIRQSAPPNPWIAPDGVDAWERSRRSWLRFAEGALAEHGGDLDRARACYREAASGGDADSEPAFFLEQLRFEETLRAAAVQPDPRSSLARLRDAASHPVFARGNLALGDALAALGRPSEAALEFERAARKAPRSADARMKRALLAWSSGDLDAARSAFEDACALRPDRPPLYRRLGLELAGGRGRSPSTAFRAPPP